jgi:hypothetical protein
LRLLLDGFSFRIGFRFSTPAKLSQSLFRFFFVHVFLEMLER